MHNHGVLAYAATMEKAFEIVEIAENVCKMNVLANIGKFRLLPVRDEKVKEFLSGGYVRL